MIRPPASKAFISWGLRPDFEAVADTSLGTFLRDMRTGKVATRNVPVDIAESPDWGTDREAAQKLLYDKACEAGAEVQFGAVVEDVYDTANEATVMNKGGTIYTADLVLAADGIRSRLRPKILADVKEPIDPVISKITLYGVRHPIEDLRSDPKAKSLIDNVNLQVWMGKKLQVVARSSNKLARWGAVYGVVSDETDQKGLWDEVSGPAPLQRWGSMLISMFRTETSNTSERHLLTRIPHFKLHWLEATRATDGSSLKCPTFLIGRVSMVE